MTAMSRADFAAAVLDRSEGAPSFEPGAYYDPDGDCIEFFAKTGGFYAERIDELLTVYRSRESGEIIGSLVKGISRLFRQMNRHMPGFVVEVHDGEVELQHVLRARLWTATEHDQVVVRTYKKILSVAGEAGLKTNIPSTWRCRDHSAEHSGDMISA